MEDKTIWDWYQYRVDQIEDNHHHLYKNDNLIAFGDFDTIHHHIKQITGSEYFPAIHETVFEQDSYRGVAFDLISELHDAWYYNNYAIHTRRAVYDAADNGHYMKSSLVRLSRLVPQDDISMGFKVIVRYVDPDTPITLVKRGRNTD